MTHGMAAVPAGVRAYMRAVLLPYTDALVSRLVFPLMWYVIIGTDVPDSLAARKAARPAHLARLEALQVEGRLLLAGPFPAIDAEDPGPAGFSGSLIIAEFDDVEAAQAWADADPYKAAGVYANVEVRPFRQTLP